jgi:hypothetical protein
LTVLEQSIAPFRAALREQLRSPEEGHPLLYAALHALAELARAQGTLAEQFVIFIKREWESAVYEQSGVRADSGGADGFNDGDEGHRYTPNARPYTMQHQQLRQSLVTAAIKAYYLQ